MKTIPQRTCMGCLEKRDKSELIRIVKNQKEQIYVDLSGKAEGRGLYLCKNINCLEKLIKNNNIEKKFRIKRPDDIYENIRGVIIDK